MAFEAFFREKNWNIVDVLNTQPRQAELFSTADLPLSDSARAFLERSYPDGIYRHQKEALRHTLDGENVCLVTGTASGKSLVFQAAAVDLLSRDPEAKVMAIYPMKALGNEQRDRWQRTLEAAGIAPQDAANRAAGEGERAAGSSAPGGAGAPGPAAVRSVAAARSAAQARSAAARSATTAGADEAEDEGAYDDAPTPGGVRANMPGSIPGGEAVGRIDGNVPPGFRLGILERARVVVFTPDIIHAWLFSNLKEPAVVEFLSKVRLIVVDEVHAYSGVFGSNAAFLFRRLQHLMALAGAQPRYICASATIAQPAAHLHSLLGQRFKLVGAELDTSPRHPLQVYLAEPAGKERFLDEVVRLLEYLTHQTNSRFIAFVDSRKQVELISSILNRLLKEARDKEKAAAAAAAAAEAAAAEPAGEPAPPKKRGRAWGKKAEPEPTNENEEPDPEVEVTGVLQQLNVVPYRAGYEDHDRRLIQERLAEGTLNGVVSTSALELGIDVPNLDICVLIGVPASATSLQQRIGRIGRHAPGAVIVVNGGDVHDQTVFAHPQSFFQRPLAESALYLENEHIQYIHALCLARPGGEHDQVLNSVQNKARGGAAHHAKPAGAREAAASARAALAARAARAAAASAAGGPGALSAQDAPGAAGAGAAGVEPFTSAAEWPENFLALCQKERAGEAPRHLASLRLEAHDRPNYTFPLRDVESQFKVERRDGPNTTSMGSLSFAQLMREAYPGAIYYYATIPYRVTRVNVKAKSVQVRREKRYTTQPQKTFPAVFPRLSPGGIDSIAQHDRLLTLETGLLVRESIRGVVEQRGRNESLYPYPLARELGFFQDQPYFSRNYFTTGIVLAHPALAEEGVNIEGLAAMVYEAFMLMIPFERQDIGFAADRFRATREPAIREGQPFLALYDQTYGSLRLSSRLLDPATLARTLAEAAFLTRKQASAAQESAEQENVDQESGAPESGAQTSGAQESAALPSGGHSTASLRAIAAMARAAILHPRAGLAFALPEQAQADETRDPERYERVVMPGSKGLMIRTNEEFHVLRIAATPVGISYEGTPTSMLGTGASVMPLLSDVAEIPGESQVGWYDLQTGQIEPAQAGEDARLKPTGETLPAPSVGKAWLAHALSVYFDEEGLGRIGARVQVQVKGSKTEMADALVAKAEEKALLDAALRELEG